MDKEVIDRYWFSLSVIALNKGLSLPVEPKKAYEYIKSNPEIWTRFKEIEREVNER
jgi:hypothetical protein